MDYKLDKNYDSEIEKWRMDEQIDNDFTIVKSNGIYLLREWGSGGDGGHICPVISTHDTHKLAEQALTKIISGRWVRRKTEPTAICSGCGNCYREKYSHSSGRRRCKIVCSCGTVTYQPDYEDIVVCFGFDSYHIDDITQEMCRDTIDIKRPFEILEL